MAYTYFWFLLLMITSCSGIRKHKCSLTTQKTFCPDSVRYAYNDTDGKCKLQKSLCSSTPNTFSSLQECEAYCINSDLPPQCKLPKISGVCKDLFNNFYYNSTSGVCEEFTHGVCQENANSFTTLQECEKTCRVFNRISKRSSEIIGAPTNGNNTADNTSATNSTLKAISVLRKDATYDPNQKTNILPVSCSLPASKGTCKESLTRYFHDPTDGQCKDFIYSGCGGNLNQYFTIEECKAACPDPCTVPVSTISCLESNSKRKFYYNQAYDNCQQFAVGMCSSSNSSNNFYSKEQCERRCVKDVCKLKFQPVKCKSSTKNIYYDSKSHSCKELDEGCLGNGNSFTTVKECQNQCMTKNPKCTLPKEQGSLCNHTTNASYFYYDAKSKQCKKYNGKCPATINKFSTHRQCLWMCQENVCMQERVPSFCNTSRFFYNLTTRKCEIFPNGNCSGKGFESKDECQMKCSLKDICTIPVTRGSCNGPEPMWHFESKTGRCEKFFYGGCERNENNFLSEAICEKACIRNPCQSLKHPATCEIQQQIYYYDSKSEMCLFSNTSCHSESNQFLSLELCEQTCIVTNPCLAPVSEKSCEPTQTRYYYDTGSGNCTRFEFNGCGGNANNYKSLEECNLACKNNQEKQNETFKFTGDAVKQRNASAEWLENKARQKSTLDQPANSSFNLMLEHDVLTRDDVYADAEAKQNGYRCILPLKVGSCDKTLRRFYFDVRSHTCRQFTYSGCQGNANNFLTRDQCIKSCVVICYHPVETTLCSGTATHYHYNPTTGMCEKTPYWVCTSSLNNFNELDTCENICVTNVCMQKKKPGPCRGSIRRFYYDTETGRCLPFFYGGCHKNGNNFLNAKDCQKQCIPSNRCMMPPDANICSVSYLAKRFYFDAISGKCQPTNKNPCDSNANSFKSLQKCESHCKALDLCLPPLKIETSCSNASKLTRFYYNKTKGVCEKHLTCLAEGFESLSSCEMKCPINICILPSEHGPCNFDSVRYYYSPESKICQPFIYGGCFGNKNNFKSLKECVSKCVQEPCNQSKKYGSCEKRNERYFYDSTTYSCLPFIDSGCRHSSNNFPTLSACQNFCATHNCQQLLKNTTCNVCELKPEAKDCEHLSQRLRFYFNSSVGRCLKYEMNKCGSSNGNSFNSLDECVKACDVGVCQLSPLHTYCGAKTDGQFYYDTKTDTCKPFKEGFCGGNLNRFSDVQQCESKCIRNICHLHKETGPCKMDKKRVFYNHFSGHCEEFHYGGCKGNKNNFFTKQNCEKECMKDPCKLPKDTGLCRAFIHKYYYNSNTGQCEEFVYGGCGGNVNRFDTREACQQKCKPNPCYQPLDAGPCEAIVIRYLYDPKSGDCKKFHYGGCKGNENNFVTYEECQQTCIKDVCEQPIKVGPCKSMIERFYYDSTAGKCERFYYGGCDGNKNNFLTKENCQKICVKDPCKLPKDTGLCRAFIHKYYYNSNTGQCEEFVYGGCGGNINRFDTREACQQKCKPNPCYQPLDAGPCEAIVIRYLYDPKSGDCKKFHYGGCKGNENNFVTYEECQQTCIKDVCEQPIKVGPCKSMIERFYYNSTAGKCERFYYGGCDGNKNNFKTAKGCQKRCVRDRCSLRPDAGPCHNKLERFYFDLETGSCRHFIYGGCFGNANRFVTVKQCEQFCIHNRCEKEMDPGVCDKNLTRFFYDSKKGRCISFSYGGCGGNSNNFKSMNLCNDACLRENTCLQQKYSGRCTAEFTRYYYDSDEGKCLEFVYGGCDGNGNNFETLSECQRTCATERMKHKNKCHLSRNRGHCYSPEERFYFNYTLESCEQFTYNGCGGNANNFLSESHCDRECKFDPCKQPIAVGSCHRREKRWYFDKRSQLCRAFYYSGCGGNNNNFESIENCEQMCVKPTCRQEMATGSCRQNMSRFYYNWNHGRCYQFTYTGCNGNENRFLSMNECMKKCTVDPCLQPLSFIGHCSEERKYFYNREFGICQAFIFNGCQSNGNIFSSAEECHKSCQHMYEIDLAR